MNSQKIKKIIAICLTSSIVLTTFSEYTLLVSAKELQSNYNSDSHTDESKKEIYLSDIDYIKEQSNVEYKSIMKDLNTDGKKIKLNVDGEEREFQKGMGCHATSTLVYDISKYKNTYHRFVSYVGIDSRQGSRGDGVDFKIYTSKDGVNWDLVKDLGIVKGNEEARYVDIDLNGANYLKLYADKNQHNGNDHSVYGDAKLVKSDYCLSGVKIDNLYPVEYYDNILSSKEVEYNIQHNQMMILRRAFVNRLGYESIQRMASKSEDYANAINYLINNELALKYFITGGPVNVGGSYQRSLKYFCDIYSKYKDELNDKSDDNFNLRLAISISLAFSREEMVRFWVNSNKPIDSVKRYEAFKELIKLGKIDNGGNQNDFGKWSSKQFKELPIPLMRWTVDTRLNDDEILWLADYTLKQKELGKHFLDAYNYIQYRDRYNYDNPEFFKNENFNLYNNKYNFSNYYNDFAQKDIHRLWMVFEEGSVCGGLAQTYSVLSEVFGRPSSPCGQPGHAASITYGWNTKNQRYEWMLQNDIYSWTQTGNQFDDRMLNWGVGDWSKVSWHNASYVILATDAIYDSQNYLKATILNLLADSYKNNKIKESIYKKALEAQKINLDSISGLINSYKSDSTIKDDTYFELSKEIINDFTYYPQVMMELLDRIKDNITDKSQIAQLDLLIHQALTNASHATPQVSTNVTACKQLADFYLGKKSNELATFSFDGKDANKIVINSKYNGSLIRVKYSLDGGKSWKDTDKQVIELSNEELNSINAENNIIVGLVGDNVTYTIDILPGKKIDNSVIYVNDLENSLIGNLDNLEFSLDNGKTWCDYTIDKFDSSKNNENDSEGSIRFDGDKSVKVRYKAHGNYLNSNEFDYKFTKDTDTDTRKYVQLKNIHVTEYSSQNDKNRAATNFIDGTPNTNWHTTFGKKEENKFYTVKLDKVRFITSLEYLSLGNNGKLRNGKIYTSLDGKEWIQSATFKDLARDNTIKVLNLDKPTSCRYIKIVADNTYGNTQDEYDMYFSGNMLNLFEDITVNPNAAQTNNTQTSDVPVVGNIGRWKDANTNIKNPTNPDSGSKGENGEVIAPSNLSDINVTVPTSMTFDVVTNTNDSEPAFASAAYTVTNNRTNNITVAGKYEVKSTGDINLVDKANVDPSGNGIINLSLDLNYGDVTPNQAFITNVKNGAMSTNSISLDGNQNTKLEFTSDAEGMADVKQEALKGTFANSNKVTTGNLILTFATK
ncbi:NPCBM/NEW2 domain-containing protein [Clostridium perfringens]|uniref:NPCBM/NEW2 domain-containing protein n=1 Tax=Clostridium perfringens TaxID=1502 RepID=UPI00244A7DCF|nr:NPCBM/NEW2 domain-containing protein [Clostridium perfringens]MDH2472695.1 NPCBM/NEW2 domain-containing protein [Clostridium perfringens]